jgi:hypothetical protein
MRSQAQDGTKFQEHSGELRQDQFMGFATQFCSSEPGHHALAYSPASYGFIYGLVFWFFGAWVFWLFWAVALK